MNGKLALMFAFAASVAVSVYATPPCPPPPCWTPHAEFDRAVCESHAEWIALGTIPRVEHHMAGPPLSKDFAEFDVAITRWMKGGDPKITLAHFQVGWCQNAAEPPTDTRGEFVFYLHPKPDKSDIPWEYLAIAPKTTEESSRPGGKSH